MTQDDKGGVGVWNTLKKDDVIYEQPLIGGDFAHHSLKLNVGNISDVTWSEK